MTKLLQFEYGQQLHRRSEQHIARCELHLDCLAFGGAQGLECVGLRQGAQNLTAGQGDANFAGAVVGVENGVDGAAHAIVSSCCRVPGRQQFQPAGLDQCNHFNTGFQFQPLRAVAGDLRIQAQPTRQSNLVFRGELPIPCQIRMRGVDNRQCRTQSRLQKTPVRELAVQPRLL